MKRPITSSFFINFFSVLLIDSVVPQCNAQMYVSKVSSEAKHYNLHKCRTAVRFLVLETFCLDKGVSSMTHVVGDLET